MNATRLVPGRWTRLPGTHIEVWWDGDTELTVHHRGGRWDLSPAIHPGRVLAHARLVRNGQPTPPWPLVPLATRTTHPILRVESGYGSGRSPRSAAVRERTVEP